MQCKSATMGWSRPETVSLPCDAPWPADEIDAIGTKRYEATSGGEREIQRTMLELLNQLDGFDSMGDVKVGLLPAFCCCRCLDDNTDLQLKTCTLPPAEPFWGNASSTHLSATCQRATHWAARLARLRTPSLIRTP